MSEHSDSAILPVEHHDDVGYDHAEPSGRPLFLLTALAAITVVVLIAGVTVFFNYFQEEAYHNEVLVPKADDLVALHAREDKQLYTYQLIDRAKGTVQLPIDRAMELVLKEAGEGKLPFPQKAMPVLPDVPPAPAAAPAPNVPAHK